MAHRDLLIGSELAGYRIESVVGRGGMGTVYLAEQVGLGRKVALKVLAPELAESDDFRLRFARESRLAASLDHPHVVPIFESGEANDVLFIAMRYVDGTDLTTLLRNEGALAPGRAAAIVSQVGSALDAAHAKGLVHRDVKPGNILLARGDPDEDEDDYAYLSDFGLTRMTSSDSALTRTGQFMGTVAYAAPEQFQGRASDAATDLYSLGCVAYECLTGERPYPREQEAAVMFAHLQEPPPRPSKVRPELPPEVDDVVAKAMAKAPEDRFPSGKAFGAALRGAVGADVSTPPGGIPSEHPTTGPAAPAFPGSGRGTGSGSGSDGGAPSAPRRRRLMVAAIVAAVVVVTGVAVIVLALGSSKHEAGGGTPTATGGAPSSSAPSNGPSSPTSGAPPGLPIAVDTVNELDPATGEVLAGYTVGSNPGSVAVSGGAVWVVNDDDRTMSKIDLASGHVTTFGGVQAPCAVYPAVGGGVWVSTCGAGVHELDPTSMDVIRTLNVPAPAGLLTAGGSVWVISNHGRFDPSQLFRFSPSGHLQARIRLGNDARSMTVSEDGTLWGNDHEDGTLWHVDPATNTAEFVPGWTGPDQVVAVGTDLWISDDQQKSVTVWDSLQRQTLGVVRRQYGEIVPTPDAVWIQNGFYDTLVRVDPATDAVVSEYQLPFSTFMTGGEGAMWLSAGSD